MAVYSVDSDAVMTATTAVRATIDRIHSDAAAMHAQLGQLQASWTGAASAGFQGVIERWRATQREVEESLSSINAALISAGQHYAQTELTTAGLFR